MPEEGDTLAGKYVLLETIGRGGMAHVYRAVHRRLGQTVAIKVLQPDVAKDAELALRFEREARVLAQMRAPHVVSVLDVDVAPNGLPYMVLEFLVGTDLDVELAQHGGRPLPVAQAVDHVHQAALGMIDAHAAGVVHRDLKPSNLFLCDLRPLVERRMVKIVDFGISKLKGEARLTSGHRSMGTPLYMSPEQVRSTAAVDERTDIWALGAILFECLTGAPAFAREQASAVFAAIVTDPVPELAVLRPDLPPELASIVMRALEKDPSRRFQTAAELAAALAPFAPDQPMARIARSLRAPALVTPPAFVPMRAANAAAVTVAAANETLAADVLPLPTRSSRALVAAGAAVVVAGLAAVAFVAHTRSPKVVAPAAAMVASPNPPAASAPPVAPLAPAIAPAEPATSSSAAIEAPKGTHNAGTLPSVGATHAPAKAAKPPIPNRLAPSDDPLAP